MQDFKISTNFSLSEFEQSATAIRLGIDNTIPTQFIPRIEQLCKVILEPLREFAGQPIVISTGYLSPILSLKAGEPYASQHTMGEAADIRIPLNEYTDWDDNQCHTNLELAHRWFDWLEHHTDFDQLILETKDGRDYHIHVSCKKNRSKNRHQVIRELRKPTDALAQ